MSRASRFSRSLARLASGSFQLVSSPVYITRGFNEATHYMSVLGMDVNSVVGPLHPEWLNPKRSILFLDRTCTCRFMLNIVDIVYVHIHDYSVGAHVYAFFPFKKYTPQEAFLCFEVPIHIHIFADFLLYNEMTVLLLFSELARDVLNRTGRYRVVAGVVSPVNDTYGKQVTVTHDNFKLTLERVF